MVYVDEWSVPLYRHSNKNVYAQIGDRTAVGLLFTLSYLISSHRHVFHPSLDKLLNLLRKACPEEVTSELKVVWFDIIKRCDHCERIPNASYHFCVLFETYQVRYNERIMVDITTLDGKKLVHIVHDGTQFSAASFSRDESTNEI